VYAHSGIRDFLGQRQVSSLRFGFYIDSWNQIALFQICNQIMPFQTSLFPKDECPIIKAGWMVGFKSVFDHSLEPGSPA
jgi:hypothetical protein